MEPDPKGGLDSKKSGHTTRNDQIQEKQCIIEIENDENEKVAAGKLCTTDKKQFCTDKFEVIYLLIWQ